MFTAVSVYVIIGVVLAAFLSLTLLKGMIKMVLFAAAVVGGVLVWVLLDKNGFSYLSFVTPDPQPWMVTALKWVGSLAVFAVFWHGLFWFCNVFSWGKNMGSGGAKGILTTLLMVVVLVWVGVMGLSYRQSIDTVSYYYERGRADMGHKDADVSIPATAKIFAEMEDNASTAWLCKTDMVRDPARLCLASIVAYACALDDATCERFYSQTLAPRIPRSGSLRHMIRDMKPTVARGSFSTLYANPQLTTFLMDAERRKAVEQLIPFFTPVKP